MEQIDTSTIKRFDEIVWASGVVSDRKGQRTFKGHVVNVHNFSGQVFIEVHRMGRTREVRSTKFISPNQIVRMGHDKEGEGK